MKLIKNLHFKSEDNLLKLISYSEIIFFFINKINLIN